MKQLAKKIRRRILKASYEAGACHIGSALSCVEILIALYFEVMKPEDIFVFSKASGVAALYSILAEKGVIPEDKVAYYLKKYPLPSKEVPGIDVNAGSLGLVLSVAVGRAWGRKLKGKKGKVYCLVSDGELDSGNNWEAILFAAHNKLDNLIVIVDYNKHQACGRTNEVLNLEPLDKKWSSFGWVVQEIDGHNLEKLKKLDFPIMNSVPTCIIAHTIKGKGVSFMEDKTEWHYNNLDKEQYEKAIRENSN